jgi:hypothetical protein
MHRSSWSTALTARSKNGRMQLKIRPIVLFGLNLPNSVCIYLINVKYIFLIAMKCQANKRVSKFNLKSLQRIHPRNVLS